MPKRGRRDTAASSQQQELPEEVLCGVCLSIFVDPCTLPCGHTWCERCLREICCRPAARCPACRAHILSLASVNIQFRQLLQRCFGEAVRARRERLPPDDMPLCNGGFEGVAIGRLLDVGKLLGLPGGLPLDTGLMARWLEYEFPPYAHEVVMNVGVHSRPIALEDIVRTLRSIPENAWQEGRSYYWEGVLVPASGIVMDRAASCIAARRIISEARATGDRT